MSYISLATPYVIRRRSQASVDGNIPPSADTIFESAIRIRVLLQKARLLERSDSEGRVSEHLVHTLFVM